ncbi:NAD(P)H-quinone oxidoreductase [Hydrogenophaga sp. BPS33]|uniref:NAD(P)H-quinone oxidoreductase n=1 Tax=Hydrogenophaga sp. BPS33 TaxID=2651974 RepID=UPI0013200E5F|nr:NAD(P)H-quinone oxidoreductase [Hydrogenophaga sp. BPS33]QHE87374.1 NAD(P)H-quinone oxidoreductase [Hydrogenophaga sp. BPS33]
MKAIEISQPGGPEVLVPAERPVPTLRAGEVLIQVAAAGVNRPDVGQRAGRYNPPPGASDLPGLEVAGTIAALGEGVSQWKVGDAVCALTPGGGYAGFCATPADHCLPVPAGLSMTEAASLPETFFTVWSNLFGPHGLKPGESVLVQGGSSGIGVTAIQLAHALGHKVFATAGSEAKCKACEALGAHAINYTQQDFVEVVQEATQGRGVDVVLDMVGGDYVPRQIQVLAPDGRLVMLAFLRGAQAAVPLGDVVFKRLVITGSALRPRSIEFKAEIARQLREKVWPLIEAGTVRPVVHSTFPLEEAWRAHALMESSQHIGKIVLTVD